MRIRWLEDAIVDLKSLRRYIADHNPDAANCVEKILESIELLIIHPDMGRSGRLMNTRELIISEYPYIIPYRVKNDTIEILRVLHGAMQWPD